MGGGYPLHIARELLERLDFVCQRRCNFRTQALPRENGEGNGARHQGVGLERGVRSPRLSRGALVELVDQVGVLDARGGADLPRSNASASGANTRRSSSSYA